MAMVSSVPPRRRTPPRVWAGLAVAVVLDVPVQLLWKALMVKYADPGRGPHGWAAHGALNHAWWFLGQTRTYGLLVLFGLQFVTWLTVLGNADLSFAQPFTALSYVAVSGCAVAFMGEHVSAVKAVGIGLILAGVVVIGSGESRTTPAEGVA